MIVRIFTSASAAILVLAARPARAQSASPRVIALPAPDATLPAEFTLVSAVRELSDGRVLIVDWSEKKLVVADLAKGNVAQLGRNGSGPGEYLQPSTLLTLDGDSTLLPDSRNGRWLLLHGATIATTIGPESPALRRRFKNGPYFPAMIFVFAASDAFAHNFAASALMTMVGLSLPKTRPADIEWLTCTMNPSAMSSVVT